MFFHQLGTLVRKMSDFPCFPWTNKTKKERNVKNYIFCDINYPLFAWRHQREERGNCRFCHDKQWGFYRVAASNLLATQLRLEQPVYYITAAAVSIEAEKNDLSHHRYWHRPKQTRQQQQKDTMTMMLQEKKVLTLKRRRKSVIGVT